MTCSNRRIITLALMVSTMLIACDQGIQGVMERDQAISAAYKLPELNALASSIDKSLRLLAVHSQAVNSDGTSATWFYSYLGSGTPVYYFHSTYHSVTLDSVSHGKSGIVFYSHPWFNSDVALNLAEANGGAEFRGRNLDCLITAALEQPQVPESSAYWYIIYYSNSNGQLLYLTVDAITGSVSRPIINRL